MSKVSSKDKLESKKYKLTKELMEICAKSSKVKPLTWFKAGKKINVNNRMIKNYSYTLTYDAGTNLKNGGIVEGKTITYDFNPEYTPEEMLKFGVFEGKYCNDQIFEFPREWFSKLSKFSPEKPDIKVNYFNKKSRLSLQEWRSRKWIPCADGDKDVRGWFEWYCRYWLGRRQPNVDFVQVKRWKAFVRHYAQYVKNTKGDIAKHPRRRQALLQWSYPCME